MLLFILTKHFFSSSITIPKCEMVNNLTLIPFARLLKPCPTFLWLDVTLDASLWLFVLSVYWHMNILENRKRTVCVCAYLCVYVGTYFPGLFSVEISLHMGKEPKRTRGLPWPWAKGVAMELQIISWLLPGKGVGRRKKEEGRKAKLVLPSLTCEKTILEANVFFFSQYFKVFKD